VLYFAKNEVEFNYFYGGVKVHHSIIFQNLDKASLQCIESLFKQGGATPQVKMVQCHKLTGTKDCGVCAIAFETAVAFQNFEHDEVREHLIKLYISFSMYLARTLLYHCL